MLNKLKIKKYLEVIKTLTRRNLLTIKVKDVNSKPEVIYKGRKLKCKKNVDFSWETQNDVYSKGYDVEIEHYIKDAKQHADRVEKIGFKSPFKD
ncbi:hypothetical protein [Staphylococcus chromogenes]|uniref:hypothetical protein n=1 Tax=Staphylococcus chromogenes TaxID=46126 RepID=UPI001C3C4BC5|nr:hypothetical protein [Staphylococcus chromogenes]MBV5138477.1 hypothetical protein [Staphylococcus chromogenes]MBW6089971.1 hypothetical protein [Staphylococcus chromogenes]MCD9062713.1 hypothetical protein [Staphylococcus chromogenes]